MARPRNSSSALLTLAAIVVAVAALHLAKDILLPLALAILISFLLTPLADRLERWRFGRIPSVIAVVGVAFLMLGGLGWIVTAQLVDLSAKLPNYRDNIIEKIRQATPKSATLDRMSETLEDVKEELAGNKPAVENPNRDSAEDAIASEKAAPSAPRGWFSWSGGRLTDSDEGPIDVRVVGMPLSPMAQMRDWLGPMVSPLTTAGIAVVLVIFMLIQREDQRNRLLQLFGGANLHATTEALTDVTTRVSRYLRMQFLINAGYGLCVGVGLWVIGLPNCVMWGVLSFSLRFLPYIGPWLSAIMPIAISLAIFDGWTQPALVLGWFAILELIVNNVAEPLLYGRSIGVSGVGVIVAAVFWTWAWGPIGLVLAMPLTVCLVVLARYVPALRFLTVLLGDQPSLAIEERIYQRLLAYDAEEAKEVSVHCLATMPLETFYDDVLIPALRLAEQDRHAGLLSEDQEEMVQDTARDLVEELGEMKLAPKSVEMDTQSSPTTSDLHSLRVLCIPLRDEADETSAIMLKQLLAQDGIQAEVTPVGALTGELVDSVEAKHFNVVAISILPPLPLRNSRLLCRRLRERYPDMPILVGCWSGVCSKEMQDRLAAPGDAEVMPTIAAAALRIRAIAGRGVWTDREEKSPAGEKLFGR